ncbi:hypothetical protein GCM10022215_01850 [Nocardioides fonticola]|uniref:Uncharacterized protein n=1 Tax=Nocardioides fonticola TaxID=450363 RepID=A0ABP7X9J8_9ACTN
MTSAGPAWHSLGQSDSWAGVRAVVLGFEDAGFAAADNLLHLGADVLVLASPTPDAAALADQREKAELLEVLGARVRLDAEPVTQLPEALDLVVVPAGTAHDHPLVAEAIARGLTVWSDAELAWRLRPRPVAAPWLVVAGPDPALVGACTERLGAILAADGVVATVAGTAGRPVVEVMMDPAPCDVLVLGIDAVQLTHLPTMAADSAALLGVRDADPAFAAVAGRVYADVRVACVYLLADPGTEELVAEAEVVEGARAIGVTLGTPAPSMVGVVEEFLVDRAFIAERASSAAEIGSLEDVGSDDPQVVTAALTAAALARAHGVSQHAVRAGLRRVAGLPD